MLTLEIAALWENLPTISAFADQAETTLPLSEELGIHRRPIHLNGCAMSGMGAAQAAVPMAISVISVRVRLTIL